MDSLASSRSGLLYGRCFSMPPLYPTVRSLCRLLERVDLVAKECCRLKIQFACGCAHLLSLFVDDFFKISRRRVHIQFCELDDRALATSLDVARDVLNSFVDRLRRDLVFFVVADLDLPPPVCLADRTLH